MMQNIESKPAAKPQSLSWIGQAVSGIVLIVIVLLHMIFHHFQEGLLSTDAVVAHVSRPFVFGLELLFVIVVTYHALVGIRAVLFDLNFSEATRRRISVGLTVLGLLTAGYGLVLAFLIQSRLFA